ncbi:MAG: hypothetical protein J6B25_08770 [Clostridia bacterium]|nr:hypothetical protein [Clostridia bacterium]
MKRALSFLLLIFLLAVSVLPAGAVDELTKVEAPYGIVYRVYNDTVAERVSISCLFTDSCAEISGMSNEKTMKKYGISDVNTYVQIDYRIDGGNWQFDDSWDTTPMASGYGGPIPKGDTVRTFDLLYLTNESTRKALGDIVRTNDKGQYVFDLENHTLEFRMRVSMLYIRNNAEMVMTSDWTDTVKVERDVDFGKAPAELEAPKAYNPRVEYLEDEMPYLAFDIKTPESIKEAEAWLSTQMPTYIQLQVDIDKGDGSWEAADLSATSSHYSNETKTVNLFPADVDDVSEMRLRVRYLAYLETDEGTVPLYSDYSEELEFEVPRWSEGKGIVHARCKICAICHPLFGQCMFVLGGILLLVIVIVAVPLKMYLDKIKKKKAAEEAEKKRKLEEERKAYDKAKQAKKNKNKK